MYKKYSSPLYWVPQELFQEQPSSMFYFIYIVSNWKLEDQSRNIQMEHPETYQALMRRIHTVRVYEAPRMARVYNQRLSTWLSIYSQRRLNEGRQLTTITFNRHLKTYCTVVGIEPRTSHKIRFTVASLLYKNGVSATTLQRLLGHSTLAMTLHYLNDVTPEEDTFNTMKAVLG